eukprot:CAMPEP_0173464514 /NCGR_PEP_ID=MMETSP1357-20121228/70102_1 /TAXON_ID=77926 /ORGANISM="Hemiselmis rufescens, Strain PCC563" /LENGTH=77 /DNA_ID=CAMNT_0014432431 /DNA_START=189 /DNA_END=422 /DNA_ORIENTATION=+
MCVNRAPSPVPRPVEAADRHRAKLVGRGLDEAGAGVQEQLAVASALAAKEEELREWQRKHGGGVNEDRVALLRRAVA